MQILIEYAALLIGAVVFGLVVWASLSGWPDRTGRPRAERFVPGNYHPHADSGDGGFLDGSQN